jgi:hypothetical protein
MLNRARHLTGFFRTVCYLPSITPAVATVSTINALQVFTQNTSSWSG